MEYHARKHASTVVRGSLAVVAACSVLLLTPGHEQETAPARETVGPQSASEPGCRGVLAKADSQAEQFLAYAIQKRIDGTNNPERSRTADLAGSLLAYATSCTGTGDSQIPDIVEAGAHE